MASEMKSILIVDDSKVNILKEQYILKDKAVIVHTAQSGADCLWSLKRYRVDLILLDIEMPEMDGFEVITHIRRNPETKDIPIILVTSEASMEIVLQASKLGVSGYIKKPFTEEELMTHIKRVFPGYDFEPDEFNIPGMTFIPGQDETFTIDIPGQGERDSFGDTFHTKK